MNREERLDYIFGQHPNKPIINRFNWLNNSLLGDIQTCVDGIENFIRGINKFEPDRLRGGGNLSIAILVCTGLELVSALYVGKASYMGRNKGYIARDNVREFVTHFFPGHSKIIPILLWDGVRNGIDHLFVPKFMKFHQDRIDFTFKVQGISSVTKSSDGIVVILNSIEFYNTFKLAIDSYRAALTDSRELQRNFIKAWKSIEKIQDKTKDRELYGEVRYLRKQLKKPSILDLFK